MKQIHEDLVEIKRELKHLKTIVEEDYELADDVAQEIDESKKHSDEEMISHEEMRKEFGE